jgi:helix-turn-helix protein
MAGRPITDEDRQRVRLLHAEGLGRNQIARQLGRSGQTISKIADDLGLSFERTATVAATEARKADAAALRAEEMLGALRDAKRIRGQLFAPARIMNFGGRDNTYNERDIPEPTFEQKRQIAQAWSLLVEKSVRLDEHDADDGADGARSMLGSLARELRVAAEHIQQEEASDP